jgi:hypothetical protein
MGFGAAGLCLLLLLIFWIMFFYLIFFTDLIYLNGIYSPLARDPEIFEGGAYLLDLVDYIIIAVTIIVMAVPEV